MSLLCNLTVLSIFPWCFTLFFQYEQTNTPKGSVSTHTTLTSTKKVQERACRTAIGAALSKGVFLVKVCFNTSTRHIYIPLRSRLQSVQTLAGTVLSLQLPPYSRGPNPFCIQLPLRRLTQSSFSTCLWKHKVLLSWSEPVSWSAGLLLTSLCIQKKKAYFASQEIEVNLKQFCRGGHPPCSLRSHSTGRWGIFLETNTKKHDATQIQTALSAYSGQRVIFKGSIVSAAI